MYYNGVQNLRRFFASKIENNTAHFSPEELSHITKVIRLRDGDKFVALFSGNCYTCELSKNVGIILSSEVCAADPKKNVTLYVAGSKPDKLELLAQKCTELGATSLKIFTSEFSRAAPKDSEKQAERLRKIATEAAKQCGRTTVPEIIVGLSFSQMLCELSAFEQVVFPYELAEEPLKIDKTDNIAIIIGSEGGFSQVEAEMIGEFGAPVTLGTRILRTETAAIAVLGLVSSAIGV